MLQVKRVSDAGVNSLHVELLAQCPSITTLFDSEWIPLHIRNDWSPASVRNKVSLKFDTSPNDVHLATGNLC